MNGVYIVIKAYIFIILEILNLYYHILRVHTLPTYRVYQFYGSRL